jgi:hypothetical protein
MSGTKTAQKKCIHHWLIETPDGKTSLGTCRLCGEIREFSNDWTDPYMKSNNPVDESASVDSHDFPQPLSSQLLK